MGTSFHITSVREGTIFNVMQFLSLERVTGTLTILFSRHIPEAVVYFVNGNVMTAEFGAIVGDAVLDVLLCQEYAIKEVSFSPGRRSQINEQAVIVKASSLSGVMLTVSKDVDRCQSRPFIYGLLPVVANNKSEADSLLHMLYDFEEWDGYLQNVPPSSEDKTAPMPQCVLIHRALSKKVISYQIPLVPLRSIRSLIEVIKPISNKEISNLRGYLRSLLPHPKATHISIERFYVFAGALESIAQRRSSEVGKNARKAIHQLIETATKLSEPAKV